jgi:tRNA A-37 threonylcarbamoyl transferase component Bud32
MRILATRPNPQLVRLPWNLPLEQWSDEHVIPLPRGLSRHVVRFVRVGEHTCAVKETDELIARREYHLLRDLQKLGLPTVVPQAVVTGRKDAADEWLPSALVTRHLRFSLPYRSLFSRGMRSDSLPALIDAMVVLLVRLHLAGFYWGDVSLSNVLFRRSAGEFAAYLVDAETGELQPELSDQQREYDLTVARENVFAELLDLQAGELLEQQLDPVAVVDMLGERYAALWTAVTSAAEFDTDEMWRLEQWVESLNDLGFDVDEMDIVTEPGRVLLQPRVVEAGHHSRELRTFTGLDVEEAQARRLLNDIASYSAHVGMGGADRREEAANRWLADIYEPLVAMVPRALRGRLELAEVFHEVLVHRWFLSERAGREIDIFETARDYIDNVLVAKPEEALASPPAPDEDPEQLLGRATTDE